MFGKKQTESQRRSNSQPRQPDEIISIESTDGLEVALWVNETPNGTRYNWRPSRSDGERTYRTFTPFHVTDCVALIEAVARGFSQAELPAATCEKLAKLAEHLQHVTELMHGDAMVNGTSSEKRVFDPA